MTNWTELNTKNAQNLLRVVSMQTNEIYLIFLTYVSTKNPIWFHAFEPSQQKVRDYVPIHNIVLGDCQKFGSIFSIS